jgi:hypothetical protein
VAAANRDLHGGARNFRSKHHAAKTGAKIGPVGAKLIILITHKTHKNVSAKRSKPPGGFLVARPLAFARAFSSEVDTGSR